MAAHECRKAVCRRHLWRMLIPCIRWTTWYTRSRSTWTVAWQRIFPTSCWLPIQSWMTCVVLILLNSPSSISWKADRLTCRWVTSCLHGTMPFITMCGMWRTSWLTMLESIKSPVDWPTNTRWRTMLTCVMVRATIAIAVWTISSMVPLPRLWTSLTAMMARVRRPLVYAAIRFLYTVRMNGRWWTTSSWFTVCALTISHSSTATW